MLVAFSNAFQSLQFQALGCLQSLVTVHKNFQSVRARIGISQSNSIAYSSIDYNRGKNDKNRLIDFLLTIYVFFGNLEGVIDF